jgi:hypothetical protein
MTCGDIADKNSNDITYDERPQHTHHNPYYRSNKEAQSNKYIIGTTLHLMEVIHNKNPLYSKYAAIQTGTTQLDIHNKNPFTAST